MKGDCCPGFQSTRNTGKNDQAWLGLKVQGRKHIYKKGHQSPIFSSACMRKAASYPWRIRSCDVCSSPAQLPLNREKEFKPHDKFLTADPIRSLRRTLDLSKPKKSFKLHFLFRHLKKERENQGGGSRRNEEERGREAGPGLCRKLCCQSPFILYSSSAQHTWWWER